MYTVLDLIDDEWVVIVETYSEQEAVVTHRRLIKQGHTAFINYEEE